LPQSVHKLGGYKVQGREELAARQIIDEALALQEAGADMALVECIPAELAGRLTETLDIPLIGIGAGPHCDAQVLVSYDMLGITPGRRPKFSKNFLTGHDSLQTAVEAYVHAVKSGEFPGPEHCIA
jgi:3-methyl-2-oxobutanoate hydroxymethyltransferase